MLHDAVVFLVIALVAAVFGFGGIATSAIGIAKILFFVFVILAVLSFLSGLMPGVMGLGSKLMGAGLGMSEISGISKETIAFAREKAGSDVVDEVVNSIPGLSQFV